MNNEREKLDEEREKIVRYIREYLGVLKGEPEVNPIELEEALTILDRRERKGSLIYSVAISCNLGLAGGDKEFHEDYRGSLGWALRNAEDRFKSANSLPFFQRRYKVEVKLGKVSILLPKMFYKKYTQEAKERLRGRF